MRSALKSRWRDIICFPCDIELNVPGKFSHLRSSWGKERQWRAAGLIDSDCKEAADKGNANGVPKRVYWVTRQYHSCLLLVYMLTLPYLCLHYLSYRWYKYIKGQNTASVGQSHCLSFSSSLMRCWQSQMITVRHLTAARCLVTLWALKSCYLLKNKMSSYGVAQSLACTFKPPGWIQTHS